MICGLAAGSARGGGSKPREAARSRLIYRLVAENGGLEGIVPEWAGSVADWCNQIRIAHQYPHGSNQRY